VDRRAASRDPPAHLSGLRRDDAARPRQLLLRRGGGTVSVDEIREFRTKVGGKTKADQIRATGAKYVVDPCANCKKQVAEIIEDHDIKDAQVIGLHDLIMRALDLSQLEEAEVPADGEEE
jgi:hypothetical protein